MSQETKHEPTLEERTTVQLGENGFDEVELCAFFSYMGSVLSADISYKTTHERFVNLTGQGFDFGSKTLSVTGTVTQRAPYTSGAFETPRHITNDATDARVRLIKFFVTPGDDWEQIDENERALIEAFKTNAEKYFRQ